MKFFILISAALALCSCNTLPQLYKSVEDVYDNDAVEVILTKDVVDSGLDVDVDVKITLTKPVVQK